MSSVFNSSSQTYLLGFASPDAAEQYYNKNHNDVWCTIIFNCSSPSPSDNTDFGACNDIVYTIRMPKFMLPDTDSIFGDPTMCIFCFFNSFHYWILHYKYIQSGFASLQAAIDNVIISDFTNKFDKENVSIATEKVNRSDKTVDIPNMWSQARAIVFLNAGAAFLTLALFVSPFRYVL